MKLITPLFEELYKIEDRLMTAKLSPRAKYNLMKDYARIILSLKMVYGKEVVKPLKYQQLLLATEFLTNEQIDLLNVKEGYRFPSAELDININFDSSVTKLAMMQKTYRAKHNVCQNNNKYSEKEILEIVRDFIETQPALKTPFNKVTKDKNMYFHKEKKVNPNCGGFFSGNITRTTKPHIFINDYGDINNAATVVHELGHYREYLYDPKRYEKQNLNIEMLSMIYEDKFLQYAKEHLPEEYHSLKVVDNRIIRLINNVFEAQLRYNLDPTFNPSYKKYKKICSDYRYTLGFLIAKNNPNINEDQIEEYLKVEKGPMDNYIKPFGLTEDTLWNEEIMEEQFADYPENYDKPVKKKVLCKHLNK